MRAVVGRVDDDRIVGDAEIVERLEQLADVPVVLDHAVGILGPRGQPRLVAMLGPHVRARVHPRRVEPAEERRAGRDLPLDEVDRRIRGLVVDRLHAFAGEWSGVLDRLPADPAPARLLGRVVGIARLAAQHAARAELLAKARVSRVVEVLGLLLGVQVVQIAEELVEAVHGRQVLVAIAEVVLAELAGGVAERLQELRDRRIAVLQPDRRGRCPDLGEPGAQRRLTGDERRSPRRAALLGVVVDEHHAFLGDPVDVRRLVAHQAVRIGADVGKPDVVAEDDEDVRLLPDAAGCACACALRTGATDPNADAAASVVLPRRRLRRLMP